MSLPHFLGSDTSLQSPACLKQHPLARMSIKILASRPKGIGQPLKGTSYHCQPERRPWIHGSALITFLHIRAPVTGVCSLFPGWHLLSRFHLGEIGSCGLPWRECREKKSHPECTGKFTGENECAHWWVVCVVSAFHSFTEEKDYSL